MNTPCFPLIMTPTRAEPQRSPTSLIGRRPVGGDADHACAIATAVVAIALGQPQSFGEPAQRRPAAFARQIAMYLAHVGFGLSMAEVGKAFDRDRTTVVHACHLIEDRRDEARFDDLLDHLEQAATVLHAANRLHRQE